jgi:tetratricopeptide (TPR) repeat protein
MLKRASEFKRQKDMVDFLRAKLKYRQGLKDVAEGLYKKIITSGSRLPELYVSAGELEAGKEDRELAEFYYAMALRYEPFNADAMLGIALARFYLERPSRAISFLKDKLLQQPNSASVMTNLAIVYQRANDLDAAKNYLSNAVKADRQYSMAFKLIGDLTKRQGDEQILVNPQQAEELYKYSLAAYGTYSQLAPTDPDGYVAVGDLYRVVNDLGNAAKSYNKVLKLAPTYPNIRIKLAKISINGGDMPKALQLINEEIKFNSNNANAYVVLGNIHLLKSEYVQAQKQFVQAARIDDKNIDAVMGLAQTLYLQGNLDGSVSLFERAAKLTPLNPQIYWNLALIYRRLNNRSLAIKALMDYKGLVKNRPNLISDADRIIAELQ